MGLIGRYGARLPIGPETPHLTLGEGSTPLIHAPRISERTGVDVWLKFEGANPTGSFKDRGMVVAVAKALEAGAAGVVCGSTGNTASSCAAYAARAGIEAVIVHPAGAVASSKLVQARATGARVVALEGNFSDALQEAFDLADREGYVQVNSTNPFRLEGQKTAAFELIEELGAAPDVLLLPYGGGGNTTAYGKGFDEAGAGMPRVHPVQSAERATTFASAIRITAPVHAAEVEAVLARSGGSIVTVADADLLDAWRLLARGEGLFCEPASAAGVAAVLAGAARPGERAVCIVTGHGLKDPDAVARFDAGVEALAGAR
jgi:threonine synthase